MEKIIRLRDKEQEKLNALNDRLKKLEKNIKDTEARLKKYNDMINQRRFSEATDVLSSKGLSLEEVMSAIKNGQLSRLQEKIATQSTDNNDENVEDNTDISTDENLDKTTINDTNGNDGTNINSHD